MHDYAKPCGHKRAANDSGPRKAASIRLIVIHSAEASDNHGADSTAEGVANYFAMSSTQASTQLAVDRDSCMRMLPDLVIPWGAKGANSDGLHVEICGRAAWTRDSWLARDSMLRRAAWKCAKWCWQYDIPARWLTDKQLANGSLHGLTTHVQVNKVFQGGSHWDPGPSFPKDIYLVYVKKYLAEIKKVRNLL